MGKPQEQSRFAAIRSAARVALMWAHLLALAGEENLPRFMRPGPLDAMDSYPKGNCSESRRAERAGIDHLSARGQRECRRGRCGPQ